MTKTLEKAGKWALAAVLLLLAARFLLPCLLPFLLAFLAAWLLEPAVRGLTVRYHMKRGFASAACVTVLLAAIAGILWFVVSRLVYEAVEFIEELPELLSGVPPLLERLEAGAERFIQRSPAKARDYLQGAMGSLAEKAREWPAAVSGKALTKLSEWGKKAPAAVLSGATFVIGTFFISAGFPEIYKFLRRQVPERFRTRAGELKRDLLGGMGRWFRAEVTMMFVTFLELTAAFLLLRVRYAAVVAAITAAIDALPVFGTGIVLVPWAIFSFLSGETGLAVGLLAAWLTAALVRNILEPKLLGREFGLSPAAALLAMYAGFRLVGVWGMILFPPGLMMIKVMNDKGYVRLWKSAGG